MQLGPPQGTENWTHFHTCDAVTCWRIPWANAATYSQQVLLLPEVPAFKNVVENGVIDVRQNSVSRNLELVCLRCFPEFIVSPEFIKVLLGQGDMNFTRLDQA